MPAFGGSEVPVDMPCTSAQHLPRHHRPHPSAYQSPDIRVATSTAIPVIAVLNLLLAFGDTIAIVDGVVAERLPSGSADFSRTLSSTLPCLGCGVTKHLAAVHQARPGVCACVCMCVCQRGHTSARVWHAGAFGGAYMFAGAEAKTVLNGLYKSGCCAPLALFIS